MLQIVFGQDGDEINDEIKKFNLSDGDKRYSKKRKKFTLDFVGFVIEKEKILAVFPKHFFNDDNNYKEYNKKEIEENIKMLFEVIYKYNIENRAKTVANKYIGYEENFESDYPFESFFKIYEYYKKYGIYKEEEVILSKNVNGKISWKDTIQKSSTIVSSGNLIFLPIYSKKKSNKTAFISECMTFVINYTIRNFSFFIQLPIVRVKECKIDFLANKEYTLRQLYQFKNTIFKDYQKELINALINFFESYDKKATGGAIHLKINYFDMIWESMVNKYLNDCFVKVDKEKNKLIFDYKRKQLNKRFENKKFNIDKSEHQFFIRPDHYYSDENTIYLFDSKYYNDITDLNYKQFSYTILLGNSNIGSNKNLYSALLLPGKSKNGLHLKLDLPYCQLNQGCNYIIEQFLSVKLLMKNYLNLNIKDELEKINENREMEYPIYDKEENHRQLKVAEDEEEYKYE